MLHLLSKLSSFLNCRPIIVLVIDIVPVHLVDSHSKYLLEILIDPIVNGAILYELIYVDGGSVTIIENEGMP